MLYSLMDTVPHITITANPIPEGVNTHDKYPATSNMPAQKGLFFHAGGGYLLYLLPEEETQRTQTPQVSDNFADIGGV